MYEDLTAEKIKEDILNRIATDIDTREGSFTNDMVSGIAYEIWRLYQSLDALIPIVYIDETSGKYIDMRCEEYGITPRKAGRKATTTLSFTGTDGTVIPKGKEFVTAEGLEFLTDKAVTIISGAASVTATAAETGENYNVDAGTITRQYANINGLSTVTNTAATGGTNTEEDSALVARLYDHLQKPATSGNTAHYKQWALEVDGVRDAKVIPLWDGPGSVKVLIVGSNNEPVNSRIVEECAEHIEKSRPIGAAVTVVSAEGIEINVTASVIIDSSTTKEKAQAAFREAIASYLQGIAFKTYTVAYNRIAYLLLDIDGVIDYTLLTVNGDVENITISEDQVPIIGMIEVL